MRWPLTAYFLLCQDKMEEFEKEGEGKNLHQLHPLKKRVYEEKYQVSKKAYDTILKRIKDEKKDENDGEETEIESQKFSQEKP